MQTRRIWVKEHLRRGHVVRGHWRTIKGNKEKTMTAWGGGIYDRFLGVLSDAQREADKEFSHARPNRAFVQKRMADWARENDADSRVLCKALRVKIGAGREKYRIRAAGLLEYTGYGADLVF